MDQMFDKGFQSDSPRATKLRPQTAAPVRKTSVKPQGSRIEVHQRLYSISRPQTAIAKRNSFFNGINTDKRPMDFSSMYHEFDSLVNDYDRGGQKSSLGSKCPSFDAVTFASMFPASRPTSASVQCRITISSAGDKRTQTAMQSVFKPNLTINAYNLSKALQLVSKDKQIREELTDNEQETQIDKACRSKSIEKIIEASKSMTDLKSIGIGRPISVGVWNVKIPMGSIKLRKFSADTDEFTPTHTGTATRQAVRAERPPLFKKLSEKFLQVPASSKPTPEIGSLLKVKSINLNAQKKIPQKSLIIKAKQPYRISDPAPLSKTLSDPETPPVFSAIFTNPDKTKVQPALILNISSGMAPVNKPLVQQRSQHSISLTASSRYSRRFQELTNEK